MKLNIITLFIILGFTSCIEDELLKLEENTIPSLLNDDWDTSTPEAENFDVNKLQQAVDLFFNQEELITSKGLLIARNGKIVLESYCAEMMDQEEVQNIKSCTKSITSTMFGMAIEQQFVDADLDKTIYSYIPENFDENEAKQTISIANCLDMTTGLADPIYTVNWYLEGNNVTTCLGVNILDAPGTVWHYNNANANIIAGILKKQTGQSFEDYTKTQLFDKLNITEYHWSKHEDGEVNAAYDLSLLPRDMLKFGQFCLQDGNWNGEQLLPTDWLSTATQDYQSGGQDDYGYQWWIDDNQDGYYAYGHGGQIIYIHPAKNLVIVHIAESGNVDAWIPKTHVLMDYIIEAAN